MKRYIKLLTLLLAGVLILSAVPEAATSAAAEERTEKVIVGTGAADSLQICKVGDRLYYFGAEGVMSCATDGSDPNEQSQLYSNPIKISEGTTQIKAISINTLGIRSGIVDKSYTVEYRIPNEPKIALNSGIYVTGQTVTISGDEGCDIYYTTDGSAPTRYSDKYTGPLRLVKGNVILTAIAISNHGKESTLASKNYIIVQNARELEQVEQMNQSTTVSGQNSSDGQNPETAEGQETSQNPNETDGWYTDETSENNSEENLFDWLLNGRRN